MYVSTENNTVPLSLSLSYSHSGVIREREKKELLPSSAYSSFPLSLSFFLIPLALTARSPGSQRVIIAQHQPVVKATVRRGHPHGTHSLVRAHPDPVHRHSVHRVHALHSVREHRRGTHRAQPAHGRSYSTHLHRRGCVRERLLQIRRGRCD